jgi:hypothetical protein
VSVSGGQKIVVSELILKKILALSKRHLQLTIEEDWEQWEKVACQKEALFRKIKASGEKTNQDSITIIEIKRLDLEQRDIIEKKRADTKKELSEVRRGKNALKTYGRTNRKNLYKRHFGISC